MSKKKANSYENYFVPDDLTISGPNDDQNTYVSTADVSITIHQQLQTIKLSAGKETYVMLEKKGKNVNQPNANKRAIAILGSIPQCVVAQKYQDKHRP